MHIDYTSTRFMFLLQNHTINGTSNFMRTYTLFTIEVTNVIDGKINISYLETSIKLFYQ